MLLLFQALHQTVLKMPLNKSKHKLNPKDSPFSFSYEAMGTWWTIKFWGDLTDQKNLAIQEEIISRSKIFDSTYSRFIKSSYILQEFNKPGIKTVPQELYDMLSMYLTFFDATERKMTPLIGQALVDAGYDAKYSFEPKNIADIPDFRETIKLLPSYQVKLSEPVILDVGALGKGFFVDIVSNYLKEKKCSRYIVDGSGDIVFHSDDENDSIAVGLEHPFDSTKAIGKLMLKSGLSICSSGINRRSWKGYHHIIDPFTKTSPKETLATWVVAETAAIADGLATGLFLSSPEKLSEKFIFDYALLTKDMQLHRSQGFLADLY
jgi:thiamine biosynthesis lipoprotein